MQVLGWSDHLHQLSRKLSLNKQPLAAASLGGVLREYQLRAVLRAGCGVSRFRQVGGAVISADAPGASAGAKSAIT